MNRGSGSSLLDRAFGAAAVVLLIAFMLSLAWQLIRPLLPVMAVITAVGGIICLAVRYRRDRW